MLRQLNRCLSLSPSWRLVQFRGANRTVLVRLLKDVEKLGEVGNIVRVKPGRMRHELYPKKQAVYAPFGSIPTVKKKTIQATPLVIEARICLHYLQEIVPKTNEEIVREQLKAVVEKLTSKEVDFRVPVKNEDEKEVSITAEIVSRFIRERLNVQLSPSLLDMPQPLTQSGEHVIPLKFKYDGRVDYAVKVKIIDTSEIEDET